MHGHNICEYDVPGVKLARCFFSLFISRTVNLSDCCGKEFLSRNFLLKKLYKVLSAVLTAPLKLTPNFVAKKCGL